MLRVVLDSDEDENDTISPTKLLVSPSHSSINADTLTATAEQGAMPSTTSTGSLTICLPSRSILLITTREVMAGDAESAQCFG